MGARSHRLIVRRPILIKQQGPASGVRRRAFLCRGARDHAHRDGQPLIGASESPLVIVRPPVAWTWFTKKYRYGF
jgi:hypothetical protein